MIELQAGGGGGEGRDEVWDRDTMFSQLAKRLPRVVVSGYLQYFSHSKYFYTFYKQEANWQRKSEMLKKIETNDIMHLCLSYISYLSFGTEIAGETVLDLNQQQCARSIYRLHRFCRVRIT